jgi:hypothetical protein
MGIRVRLEPTRREAIAGVGAAFGIAAGLSTPVQAQTASKTFVLVHGSWHGGWCGRPTSFFLAAAKVIARNSGGVRSTTRCSLFRCSQSHSQARATRLPRRPTSVPR